MNRKNLIYSFGQIPSDYPHIAERQYLDICFKEAMIMTRKYRKTGWKRYKRIARSFILMALRSIEECL